ncbi:phospholipase A2 inhibitor and Ly6/PLAUR domain-containing protein-like [Terrapene carolina triunguis]|uniref:phospholipase A2 inhibitor and Ly6/PLAUR domain-containing protein-like n=1 Tax=Terrapene triunguis TaxID=2587831 RepID=UPI000E777758|nr:phospholipase A2 inhibitor and Ly6/PLAUR domain-containing protein-like [Terrapene carolina triunguis]
MTKVLIALCVLSALQATAAAQNETGTPLACFYCKSGQSCHTVPQTCSPPQDACIIVQEHNTFGAENSGTYQSCADSRQSLTGFLAFYFGAKVAVEIRSEICKSGDCSAESTPSRQAISNVPNGLQCPACYAPGFESCESDGNLRCTGGADQCAAVGGTLAQGGVAIPFAGRGCATRAACEIKTLESGVFTYKLTNVQCSPAPKAQTSSATPTLAWGPFTLASIVPRVPLFLPFLLGLFLC